MCRACVGCAAAIRLRNGTSAPSSPRALLSTPRSPPAVQQLQAECTALRQVYVQVLKGTGTQQCGMGRFCTCRSVGVRPSLNRRPVLGAEAGRCAGACPPNNAMPRQPRMMPQQPGCVLPRRRRQSGCVLPRRRRQPASPPQRRLPPHHPSSWWATAAPIPSPARRAPPGLRVEEREGEQVQWWDTEAGSVATSRRKFQRHALHAPVTSSFVRCFSATAIAAFVVSTTLPSLSLQSGEG